jgi:hypothetical protein
MAALHNAHTETPEKDGKVFNDSTIRRFGVAALFVSVALGSSGCGSSSSAASSSGSTAPADNSGNTVTPIKHVVFIVGENRSFDNLFATYQPQNKAQSVFNLLSEGIVTVAGKPGPNFSIAAQQQASDTDAFLISPDQTGAFAQLPQPNLGENMLLGPFSTVYESLPIRGFRMMTRS